MTGFDFIALAVLLCSTAVGMLRGFIREVLSLFAFAAAFVGAVWWGPWVHVSLAPYIETELLRLAVAYIGVFFAILLLVGVINLALSTFVASTGLAPADRGLGMLFGVVRGLLILFVLMLGAGYTALPAEAWWRNALLARPLEQVIVAAKERLPQDVGQWIPYPYQPPPSGAAPVPGLPDMPGLPSVRPPDAGAAQAETI
ncbi:CvpA family protein [Verticiella sediminum]|uniref:CvpA family protein n=1 Tax=Verticiella sediminum TaxID=1247510 RepID=A0A556AY67_9BURK|nr:CvpA family protein [Verticiella sediminum]TSH97858.1 CvpA family protein [Verticiella sediminum]